MTWEHPPFLPRYKQILRPLVFFGLLTGSSPSEPRCSVQCDDTLTQDEQDYAHSSVHVDVLCVEVSLGGHVVIGVGRVIVQRHHADITYQLLNSHFCTFGPIVHL